MPPLLWMRHRKTGHCCQARASKVMAWLSTHCQTSSDGHQRFEFQKTPGRDSPHLNPLVDPCLPSHIHMKGPKAIHVVQKMAPSHVYMKGPKAIHVVQNMAQQCVPRSREATPLAAPLYRRQKPSWRFPLICDVSWHPLYRQATSMAWGVVVRRAPEVAGTTANLTASCCGTCSTAAAAGGTLYRQKCQPVVGYSSQHLDSV